MYKLLRTKFVILILSVWAVFVHTQNACADFGQSCVAVPVGAEKQYLQNSTAYGYLQQFLDMSQYPANTSCNDNLPIIKICIQNTANNPPCDFVSFTPGQEAVFLSKVSKSPLLGQNPLFSTLTLSAEYTADPTCNTSVNSAGKANYICSQFLCVTMPTPYGNEPLLCKQIITESAAPTISTPPPTCVIVADSCTNAPHVSQSMFSFSGPAVQCLVETLNAIFYDPQPGCVGGTDVNLSFLADFASFQNSLKVSVRALLILYAMGYGITLLMNPGKLSAEGVVMFVVKMMLVGYFSVGWGPLYFNASGVETQRSGMLDWGIPILTQLTSNLAQIAFDAGDGGSGLCEFNDDNYPDGFGYYSLWDRIDCKLGAYVMVKKIYGFGFLGRKSFSNGWTEVGTSSADTSDPITASLMVDPNGEAASSAAQMGMAVIIFLLLLGGSIALCISLTYFLVVIISLILGFVSLYTVCLVTLFVLIYVSPIFVPMVLFQRTKTYFDSWLKVTLGCALQPMVVAGFIAFAMNLYDDVLFGGCKFLRHDYSNGTNFISTFEPRLPQGDYASCVSSPGYMILGYILGYGWDSVGAVIFTMNYAKDELNLLGNSVLLLVFSYIMRFFVDNIYTMAADLVGGANVSSVALNVKNMATAAQKKITELLSKGADQMKDRGKKGPKGNEGKDKKDDKKDGGDGGETPKEGDSGDGGATPKEGGSGDGGAIPQMGGSSDA